MPASMNSSPLCVAISETVNSSIKQRYGSALTAMTWYGEFRELVIKCIVHNLRRAVA